jgi:hypothetical protein
MTKAQAFLAGYICKEADLKDIPGKLALLAITAPLAVGVGAGALASKMTSPSSLDHKALQNKLKSLELQEYRTELERRKELAKKKGIAESKDDEVQDARSIRI